MTSASANRILVSRLKSRKDIDTLFRTGKAYSVYPIRAIIKPVAAFHNLWVEFGVAVSKKNFKRAHDRNLIKRRLRAAWQQENKINWQLTGQYHLFLIFTGKSKVDQEYSPITTSLRKIIAQINSDCESLKVA